MDISKRFPENPLLIPKDLPASRDGCRSSACSTRARFALRVKRGCLCGSRRASQQKKECSIFPRSMPRHTELIEVPLNDPDLIATDPKGS
ncbi:MAG: hypothetical protein ACTHJ8_14475 [Mucilaginibacter sp.]